MTSSLRTFLNLQRTGNICARQRIAHIYSSQSNNPTASSSLPARPFSSSSVASFTPPETSLSRGFVPTSKPKLTILEDDDAPIDLSEDYDLVNGARPGTPPVHLRQPSARATPEEWRRHRETLKERFPDGWSPPRKISREAMAGLRQLHAVDPTAYTTEVLADRFKISPEAVRRILKSKWEPSRERKDKLVQREKEARKQANDTRRGGVLKEVMEYVEREGPAEEGQGERRVPRVAGEDRPRQRFGARDGGDRRPRFGDRDGGDSRPHFSDRDGGDRPRSRVGDSEGGDRRPRFSDRDGGDRRPRFSERDGGDRPSRFSDRDGADRRPRFNSDNGDRPRRSSYQKDGLDFV